MIELLKRAGLFKESHMKTAFFLATSSRYSTASNHQQLHNQSGYSIIERGQKNTNSYRLYFKDDSNKQLISPFHDIPLYKNKSENIVNLVVEIPRWTNAKMEVNKANKLNPIMQDIKKNKLRFVHNVFPYHGYIWNYGGIPQTWEDPNVLDKTTNCIGDNDPLDVLELGSRIHATGSVLGVKVLGALGLIDEGEADWKVLTIDQNDPLANRLNDLDDIEKHLPGLLDASRDWFKFYKIPAGKPPNQFASDGKFFNKEFALKLIEHDHESWKKLMNGDYPEAGIKLENTSLKTSKSCVGDEKAWQAVENDSKEMVEMPEVIDSFEIDRVHYINRGDY